MKHPVFFPPATPEARRIEVEPEEIANRLEILLRQHRDTINEQERETLATNIKGLAKEYHELTGSWYVRK